MMSLYRGWLGERKTAFYMWLWLRSKTYIRFHNIIIPSSNGTTQIDHLIISIYGLFIVETKNRKGWIFGSTNQRNWTQSLYGKTYPFQNPLRQTYRQQKVLSEFLELDEDYIRYVIYFIGGCTFKTPMPVNVINSGLGRYLKRFRDPVLSKHEVQEIVNLIKQHITSSSLSNKDHVRSLRERHASNTICPRCGSVLVEKLAKKGPSAGSKFLGCTNYPKCRFTKNV